MTDQFPSRPIVATRARASRGAFALKAAVIATGSHAPCASALAQEANPIVGTLHRRPLLHRQQ